MVITDHKFIFDPINHGFEFNFKLKADAFPQTNHFSQFVISCRTPGSTPPNQREFIGTNIPQDQLLQFIRDSFMAIRRRIQLVHRMHLYLHVRNGGDRFIHKIREQNANHRLHLTFPRFPHHMTDNQHIVPAAHNFHDYGAQTVLYVQIRLSVRIPVLQLIPLPLHVFLRIPLFDLLVRHSRVIAAVQLAQQRAALDLHHTLRSALRCNPPPADAPSARRAAIGRIKSSRCLANDHPLLAPLRRDCE